MSNIMNLSVILFSLLAYLATLGQAENIFCYYSSFAYKRHGLGNFLPENVNAHLCTHLIYAFVDITPDGRDLRPFNKNDQGPDGLYARTMSLKDKNPALKILLAVGGWQVGSKPFIPMVETEDNRRAWIANVIAYLRRHNFDGFDIDWEFPATRGSPPEDKYRFTLLMKGLYEAFHEESVRTGNAKLLLTLATASGTYYIDQSYETDKIYSYIDFMLLMTYNYHGQWEKITGHHSGLYRHKDDPTTGEKAQLYQQWSIDYWLDAGVPKEKLVVGLPTYGMSFTLADPSDNGVRAPARGGGRMGDYTRETGILAYYEVCSNLKDKGWTTVWIDEQEAPYAFSGDQWVGYEDSKSILLKAKNIKSRGLAGAFVWSVEMDDFKGTCGEGKYPLLTTIQDVLGSGSRAVSPELHSKTERLAVSEVPPKIQKIDRITAPPEVVKPVTEESTSPSVKGFRKKFSRSSKIVNAAAASAIKPVVELSSRKQVKEEIVEEKVAKREDQGVWWLDNAWKGKRKNWWKKSNDDDLWTKNRKNKNLNVKDEKSEELQVKEDKIENLQVTRETTDNSQVKGDLTNEVQVKMDKVEELHVNKEKNENVRVKTGKIEDLRAQRETSEQFEANDAKNEETLATKIDDFHLAKNRIASKGAPKKTSDWYIPVESAEQEFNEVSVEVVELNPCRGHGTGTFPDPRSCEQFIVCMPGDWLEHSHYVMTCPGGTRFDPNLKICNYASSVSCHL